MANKVRIFGMVIIVFFFVLELLFFNKHRDIDSDGEEILNIDENDKPQMFTFWFALDIKVDPTDPQAVVEIETACFVCVKHKKTLFFIFLENKNNFSRKRPFSTCHCRIHSTET
jgi:hypothetical protein